MEIKKTYEYRAEFSRETISSTQNVILADDAPREAVKAESILLGVKVQLGVISEAYLSDLIDDDEFLFKLKKVFYPLLSKSRKEIKKLEEHELEYDGLKEFVRDFKSVKKEIDGYVDELEDEDEEEDDE